MITIQQLLIDNLKIPNVIADIIYSYMNPYTYKGLCYSVCQKYTCYFCGQGFNYGVELNYGDSSFNTYVSLGCYKKQFGIYKKGRIKIPKHYLTEAEKFYFKEVDKILLQCSHYCIEQGLTNPKYHIRKLVEV